MKNKLLLVAFVLTLGLATKTTQAQVFYEGVNHLNVGVGLGGYGSYAYIAGSDYSRTPTIFLSFDHGFMDDLGPGNLGLGAFLGFSSAHANYNYAGLGYEWDYKWSNFVIGARGTYHLLLDVDNVDLYGALSLGLWAQTYKYTNTDPFWNGTLDGSDTYMNLYYAFSVGGKYMFSENFGAFAELGYDVAYLKLGVTLGL